MNEEETIQLKKRLPQIKTLAMLKMEKNFIAQEKGYPRQPYKLYSLGDLYAKLIEEVTELHEAMKQKNTQEAKRECADISNVVDYFFEKLLEESEKQ